MKQTESYDAFISYRHLSPDSTIANILQRLLESLRSINPDGKKGEHLRVFRDQSELPASDDLGKDIENALRHSKFLILICSRRYKESVWCMREVELFRRFHGSTAHILPILIDGTPEECFPPCLFEEEINALGQKSIREPMAANVSAKNSFEMWRHLLSTEYLRIAAPIVGVPFDRLYQRRKRNRIAITVTAALAIITLSVGFGVYNKQMLNQIEAKQQTIYAKEADRLAELSEEELENQNYPLAMMLAQRAVEYEIQAGNDPKENSAAGSSLRSAVLQKEYEETHDALRTRLILLPKESADEASCGAPFRNGDVIAFSNFLQQKITLYDTKTGELLFQAEGKYAALNPEAEFCVVSDGKKFTGYYIDTGESFFSWEPEIVDNMDLLTPYFDLRSGEFYLLVRKYEDQRIDPKYSAVVDVNGNVHMLQSVPEGMETLLEKYTWDYNCALFGESSSTMETTNFTDLEIPSISKTFEENEWTPKTVYSRDDYPFIIIEFTYDYTNSKGYKRSDNKVGIFDPSGKREPYIK